MATTHELLFSTNIMTEQIEHNTKCFDAIIAITIYLYYAYYTRNRVLSDRYSVNSSEDKIEDELRSVLLTLWENAWGVQCAVKVL